MWNFYPDRKLMDEANGHFEHAAGMFAVAADAPPDNPTPPTVVAHALGLYAWVLSGRMDMNIEHRAIRATLHALDRAKDELDGAQDHTDLAWLAMVSGVSYMLHSLHPA